MQLAPSSIRWSQALRGCGRISYIRIAHANDMHPKSTVGVILHFLCVHVWNRNIFFHSRMQELCSLLLHGIAPSHQVTRLVLVLLLAECRAKATRKHMCIRTHGGGGASHPHRLHICQHYRKCRLIIRNLSHVKPHFTDAVSSNSIPYMYYIVLAMPNM